MLCHCIDAMEQGNMTERKTWLQSKRRRSSLSIQNVIVQDVIEHCFYLRHADMPNAYSLTAMLTTRAANKKDVLLGRPACTALRTGLHG